MNIFCICTQIWKKWKRWKSRPHPLWKGAVFLFALYLCAPSVSICYPSTWQRTAEAYDGAEEPHVDRSETLPLWQRLKREPVTAWSLLSDSNDGITRHHGSCAKAYMHSVTYMMRERGQKVKKWDATCVCSASVLWMVSMSGIPIAPYWSRDCDGADPGLSLHFTCYMVNKSSQDFVGLVST